MACALQLVKHVLAQTIIFVIAALSANPQGAVVSSNADIPQIAEVQRRAIEHARLDPTEISSWKKRARLSALLPRLQVDYARRVKNAIDVNIADSVYVGSGGVTVGPEEGAYKENADSDQNIGFKAVWNFSEAVFNPDMLAVSEEARHLARERQAILAEVNRNYYERKRLIGEIGFLEEEMRRNSQKDKIRREVFAKRVAFDEATAALDALTGGWFSEELRRKGGGLR